MVHWHDCEMVPISPEGSNVMYNIIILPSEFDMTGRPFALVWSWLMSDMISDVSTYIPGKELDCRGITFLIQNF